MVEDGENNLVFHNQRFILRSSRGQTNLWLDVDVERGGGWLGADCDWTKRSGEMEVRWRCGGHICG